MLGQVFTNDTQDHSSGVVQAATDYTKMKINKTSEVSAISAANRGINSRNDWNLILVNPWNKVPDNFGVELTKLKNGQSVDKRIYPELQEMLDAARGEGLSPVICSSFRTMEKQQYLFNNQVNKYVARGYSPEQARNEAAKWVAVPGTSEHQTGLAVDIVSTRYQSLDKKQEETAEQQWLMKNCYKYGFILRYPSDKGNFTGIGYEPWHYRYVGKEAAKQIMEKGICLEEYLKTI
ncbi:D-alanyl-D-alanine carboxypeptidase family protein [Aminipila terrae]|uniref:D-alanyl-D-alanine carboxypeptidase family protein n=2 Tax=Aminipila terrae TaxID=2697030 RepID=A0A6P1MIR0_9FIRM|nr:D-alanyl-D-alanine carboxypeptidase family protein [Aminipila terrae]